MDYRELTDLMAATSIRLGQVECLKAAHRRGFPFQRLAKKWKDNTITVKEFDRLHRHIEKVSNKPVIEVTHALF